MRPNRTKNLLLEFLSQAGIQPNRKSRSFAGAQDDNPGGLSSETVYASRPLNLNSQLRRSKNLPSTDGVAQKQDVKCQVEDPSGFGRAPSLMQARKYFNCRG